jgi:hypothetical protein
VAASAAADQCPDCFAPAGQNRNRCAWCSPSDLQQTKFYENEILCSCGNETSVGYDREKRNIGFTPNVLTRFYYFFQVGLGSICMNKFNY